MKKSILKIVSAVMLAFGITFASAFAPLQNTSNPLIQSAYADENDDASTTTEETPTENPETPDGTTAETEKPNKNENPNDIITSGESPCNDQAGAVAWMLCSTMVAAGNLVDALYSFIENLLVVQPISNDEDLAIIHVWRIARNITNVAFVIFLLIVIYSQLTGLGISNYGVKRVLPRLIIAVVMVNLSFLICSFAVDISNIIGSSITGLLGGIQDTVIARADLDYHLDVLWSDFAQALTVGGMVAGVAVAAFAGIKAIFWGVVLALIGAIISLAIGLVTIALRQGLVLILVMIAPLAFLAYLLPNTEKWFEKWRDLFVQMLVFYPMFSLLVGASKLAGWAIIASAEANLFTVLIGMIVEVVPIFFSFSLFKMSGNVLGNINAALQRASTPLRAGTTDWAASHQELERQKYISSSFMPGARLRRFLDSRKEGREINTATAADLRKNLATERALNRIASYRGIDAEGNAVVGSRLTGRAKYYTRLHKRADVQKTLAATAQQNLANNLSDYDNTFRGMAAKRLATRGAEAFIDSTKQQFRAENIAMGDQSYLLDRYLQAAKDRDRRPYEFNRLIGGAASSIGHLGEASIIGQVIDRSVQIENRRRREALVVANKFGYSKSDFRGMVFDKARINDDGFEEDENGQRIENDDYVLLPGKRHREWGQYVAIHKENKQEISKEEYLSLSEGQRAKYRKVRYMEIKDDNGDVIQKVYDDDNGYMKELLRQDIAIGDPINVRYLNEIGLARQPSEYSKLSAQYASQDRTGILRRYHSTITAAMLESKYAEHNAAVTAMLTAQANNGYITSTGQYHIAELESLWKAAKSGKILQNDAPIIKSWKRIIDSLTNTTPGERFEDIFDDASIALAQNVNGMEIHGLRKTYDKDGKAQWYKIDRNDADITIDDKRNWIKYRIMPAVIQKIIGSLDRRPSPTVLDSQKPDGTLAFYDLIESATKVGARNLDPNTSFEDRIRFSDEDDILDAKDPQSIQRYLNESRNAVYEKQGLENPKYASNNKQKQAKTGVPMGNHQNTYFDNNPNHQNNQAIADILLKASQEIMGLNTTNTELKKSNEQEEYLEHVNDIDEIVDLIERTFDESGGADIASIGSQIVGIFQTNETLRGSASEAEAITGAWADRYTEDIKGLTDTNRNIENEYISKMRDEIIDLVYRSIS